MRCGSLDFRAGGGAFPAYHITGEGIYTRFEEFAILQDMTLSTQVQDAWTNQAAYFTNNSRIVQQPFPLIQADLTQTNGTLLHTFSMHLFAAPAREIWFSTAKGFVSTNRFRAHESDQRRGPACPTAVGWSSGTASWWAGSGSCRRCRTWDWMRRR